DEGRLEAISIVAYTGAEGQQTLEALLSPEQPLPIQLAATRGLLTQPTDKMVAGLLEAEHWQSYSPPVHEAVIASLIGRPAYVGRLLAAIEGGVVKPTAVLPAQREKLMKHADPAIRDRANAIFAQLGGADRRKVYKDCLSVLKLQADASRGGPVFTR